MRKLLPTKVRILIARLVHIYLTARRGYQPYIPSHVDEDQLLNEISYFFNLNRVHAEIMWQNYRAFSEKKRYASLLGERKTLSTEEAFIIYVILFLLRPKTIVEIGTQYGWSTRRIIDIVSLLGLDSKIVCFDIVDQVEYFTSNEAQLFLKDVTWTFREDVLDLYKSGFIFLDARPYYLLKNTIQELVEHPSWSMAIHDCSRGLCNPRMLLSKDDPNITSRTGVWERHVLAEIFGVEDATSNQLDDVETTTHCLKIFSTPHGLAVIIPKVLLKRSEK